MNTLLMLLMICAHAPAQQEHVVTPSGEALHEVCVCLLESTARSQEPRVVSPGIRKPDAATSDIIAVDVQPVVKKHGTPKYPPEALASRTEGKVWIKALVDTTGKITETEVISTENAVFNAAALDAAAQFVFSPAMKDNKPVAIWITIPFNFKLAEKSEGKDADRTQPGHNLTGKAWSILEATMPEKEIGQSVQPSSYLIDGSAFVDLAGALKGDRRGTLLQRDRNRKLAFTRTTVNDDGTTGVVIMKTEGEKKSVVTWHTVTWEKGKDGTWKIAHWHASK
jgi:TonB family protein